MGLDIVVPLIEGDLLKIPKLCRIYFQLLGYMLEAFPERMVALSGDAHQLPHFTLPPIWIQAGALKSADLPGPDLDRDLAAYNDPAGQLL